MLTKLVKTDRAETLSPLKNTDGFILVIGLLILLLLTALGAVALRTTTTETAIVGNERSSNGLMFAADAGIERAKNQIWTDSAFGNGASVTFASLDTLFTTLPKQIFTSTSLASGLYYTVKATAYDTSNGAQRQVTLESQSWRDTNGNSSYDPGEQTKTIVATVRYSYSSMNFPFGLMTQNTECIFCHTRINGDVVSLESMTIRKTNEAYSVINGKVYTAGTTNVNAGNSRVVKNYVDQNGSYKTVENAGETAVDITTNYTDPRFPLDKNGNPSWPQIGNLTYYQGLAASYNGGAGSSISGGSIKGVPPNGTYPGNAVTLTSVSQTYTGNLILDGTSSCLNLNGPIVATGDIIIKGCVKGTGNLYTGGNVYVAGAVKYNNSSTDMLSLAAGGNVVMGNFGSNANMGGKNFINKQINDFNDAQAASGIPAGQRRYYADDSGKVDGSSKITPAAGDKIVSYMPTNNWITDNNYSNILDSTNGITQIDGLVYTSNAIFGINKVGNQQTTINGALVSADIGILITGPQGHDTSYDPALTGLTINYDSRLANFLSVARNPVKKIVSWKEK